MESNIELKPLDLPGVGEDGQPLVIAGPCSAETEAQVIKTAGALKAIGVKVFRAGLWKPRTRPGAFEGAGVKALPWLKRVRNETGMLVTTEVATAEHVKHVLAYDVDILWIGARTTANPFAVEEIARSLEGIDIPVLIKNPISPDLSLWIGAIERFANHGIRRLGAVHRGFYCDAKSSYRNPPKWNIPLQLMKQLPNIPLLHDPSHTTGDRNLIYKTARKALDYHMNGLMVEVHPNPDQAWSDSKQQVAPEMFEKILKKLNLPAGMTSQPNERKLEELRAEIDTLDQEILNIMEKRMVVSRKIGHFKNQQGMQTLQQERWEQLISGRINRGRQQGMSRKFIERLFETIHVESIEYQKNINGQVHPETRHSHQRIK